MKNKSIFKNVYCNGTMLTAFIVSVLILIMLSKTSTLANNLTGMLFYSVAIYIMISFVSSKAIKLYRRIKNGKEKGDI